MLYIVKKIDRSRESTYKRKLNTGSSHPKVTEVSFSSIAKVNRLLRVMKISINCIENIVDQIPYAKSKLYEMPLDESIRKSEKCCHLRYNTLNFVGKKAHLYPWS